jgi:hypothetical protein
MGLTVSLFNVFKDIFLIVTTKVGVEAADNIEIDDLLVCF